MHTKLEGAIFCVLSTCFGEADLECYGGDLGLDAQDWKALTRLSLREAAVKSNPKNDFMVSGCQCKTYCTCKKFMQMQKTWDHLHKQVSQGFRMPKSSRTGCQIKTGEF